MLGKLAKVEFKTYETKQGKKFQTMVFWVDVVDEKNEVRCYRGSMGIEYAKKYFEHCGKSSVSAIGCDVDVTLRKRMYTDEDGEVRTVTEVKYMNFLDDSGKKVFLTPKEDSTEGLPF